MKEKVAQAVKDAKTLEEIKDKLIEVIGLIKTEAKAEKLGFVSGMLTSEGREKIPENARILDELTEELRTSLGFPVFTSTDAFSSEKVESLGVMKLPDAERQTIFFEFWKAILKCGHITDIFMAPRWDKSEGAIIEHETAKEIGLTIHYLKKS